jgi:octaprenyl-diphosphate synthase
MPTVNSLWNDQVSVIMGDYLFCTAFRLLHEAELFEVASVLSEGSDNLTFGEMFQMDLRGRYDISEETYLSMIRHKTASLFASASEAGAIVGGLTVTERTKLSQYGECLGVAFQMIDDVLDLVGDAAVMGKPVGNDLRDERTTLPVIVALRDAGERDAARIREIIASRDLLDHSWDEVVGLIERNGGVAYARRKAQDLAARAKSHISDFHPCAAKESLMQLADVVVARKR